MYLVLRYQPQNQPETAEAPVTEGETEVAILAVNDMHANIDLFPKFAAMVDSLRAIYPDLLLFSAGDNLATTARAILSTTSITPSTIL